MNITIADPHQDYPSHVRDSVEARLETLGRFHGRVSRISVTLGRQRTDHHVELVAHVAGGGTLVADVRREEFSEAFDEAMDRMATQLRKAHDKLVDRHHARR